MARKSGNAAVLEVENTSENAPRVTLPLEYKGRHCPKLSPADFWAATKAYPRNATTCYKLYRLFPVIDRKLSGEELKDIADRPELDAAGILAEFGAGEYQVYFIDGNSRPSSMCSTVISFEDLWEHPPVLNQVELVEGHPKNKGYIEGLKARGLWRRDTEQTERNDMATAEANQAATTAVQELAGITKNALANAGKEKPADRAANEAVGIVTAAYKTALSTVREESGNGGRGGGDAFVALLMEELRASREQAQRSHELLVQTIQNQNRPASGPSIDAQLNLVERFMGFGEKLAEKIGGAPSRPSSFMDRLPDMAVALLPALLQRAAAAPAPMYQPAPVPVSAVSVAPGPAPAANPSEDEDAMFAALLPQLGFPAEALPFVKSLVKIGRRAKQAYVDGYSGSAFAENVCRVDGEDAYEMIAGAGKAEVLGLLGKFAPMMGAEFSGVVASPEFSSWLDDFFAYGSEPTEGTEGTEGATE